MVGKLSSLKTLIAILQHEGISRENIVTTTLRQGVTHRWCLGWTFDASAAAQYRAYCAQRNLQRQDAQKRRTDIEMKEQEREEKKLKLEKQEGNVEAAETYNDEKASLSIINHDDWIIINSDGYYNGKGNILDKYSPNKQKKDVLEDLF